MRKLATIQRIVNLEPIEGADKIEKATVLGWSLVVKKGEFSIGEPCIYVEIDSILPDRPEFDFMRERKFRVKTIKLRQQVSQGICFPLSILPKEHRDIAIDDDVTDILGIKKYDPQAEMENKMIEQRAQVYKNRFDKFLKRYSWYRRLMFRPDRLPFPQFISKTDEERVQNIPWILEKEKETVFQLTEKLDGQSATYFLIKNPKQWQFWQPYLFGVCSRNFQLLKKDNSSYWRVAKTLNLRQKMIKFHKLMNQDIVIQGEILGSKIQGNKYKVSGYEFYIFNAITGGNILNEHTLHTLSTYWGIKHVPYIDFMDGFHLKETVQEVVEQSKGNSLLNKETMREGIIVRNYEKGISFKVINPDFLLLHNE